MNVNGHAALVTGGGSGLGAETARHLANAGAKVCVLDVNAEAVAAVAGPRARNSSFTAAETGSAAASFVGRGSRVAVAWLR